MGSSPAFGRRALLQGASAVACAHLVAPGSALASDLGQAERMNRLYSKRLTFDAGGEPLITVGLMQGQREVHLRAPGGVRVMLSGEGSTAITGGSRWTIRRLAGRSSQQRFAVILASVPATDNAGAEAARARYARLGLDVELREVGALFGVRGLALDARRTLVTTGLYDSEAEATRAARRLKQRHGALGHLHPVVRRRASGALEAMDLDHGVTIRAEGALWFEPVGGEALEIAAVAHGGPDGHARRADRRYRGQIYVAIDHRGELAVVNRVRETDLLSGLVPAEIYPSAPPAALRAQAIAARGQLVAKVGTRHLDDPFLLCAHQHCQVYAGMVREDPRTTRAVRATRGQLLLRPNAAQLVDTVYSANSGGHSEDNDLVWPSPQDPQLRGRPDPLVADRFPRGIPKGALERWLREAPRTYSRPASDHLMASYRWRETVDPARIAGREGVPRRFGVVSQMEVLTRGRSGRALTLRLTSRRGEHVLSGELTIRRALGHLRSSMFLVEPERDSRGHFVLLGGGHGHGVGLCQHGAMGMAAAGLDHRAILTHYYRGGRLVHLW